MKNKHASKLGKLSAKKRKLPKEYFVAMANKRWKKTANDSAKNTDD